MKKLSGIFVVDDKTFYQEIDSLMNVKHKNIVRFLGYCANTEVQICELQGKKNVRAEIQRKLLCFEFMPKGSLDRHIARMFASILFILHKHQFFLLRSAMFVFCSLLMEESSVESIRIPNILKSMHAPLQEQTRDLNGRHAIKY